MRTKGDALILADHTLLVGDNMKHVTLTFMDSDGHEYDLRRLTWEEVRELRDWASRRLAIRKRSEAA